MHVIIRKKVFLFIKIMLMMACSNQILKIYSNIFPNLVSMLAIFYIFLANTFMSHRQLKHLDQHRLDSISS
jgi:hypothetical protein